jgi:hypothetical protein
MPEEAMAPEDTGESTDALVIPSGFYQIKSGTGFRLYRKDYSGGQPDFVAVVDLRYATLRNLTGAYTRPWDGSVYRKSMSTFWNDAVAGNTSTRTARMVINGTFFSTNDNPTPLAFGLKSNGTVIHYGYGLNEFPGLVRTFHFNMGASRSAIKSYATSNFDAAGSDPDVVGALDPTANKSASSFVQRTFVGVHDSNGDGIHETVLTYSSAYARQVDATSVLQAFGANGIAMLDGGGSTGLIVDGSAYIAAGRTVPHAIAIYSGR